MFPQVNAPAGACRQSDALFVLGRHRIRTALAAGEWISPWPGVLVDPRRAAEPLTIVTAAWLATGDDALVTGQTAAYLHGYSAAEPTPVHLVVPYESFKRRKPGIVLHNARELERDRTQVHGLPTLVPERILSDLACTASPATALAVLDQALARVPDRERAAMKARLTARLAARPDPRGTRIAARLVDLATGRAESPAESWILWRVVDLGFPVPQVNHWISDLDGQPRYRLDLAWPGVRIAVEHQGFLAHLDRPARDASRRRFLESLGWLVIETDADDLRSTNRLEGRLHDAFVDRGIDLRDRTPGALRARRHRERHVG